MCSRRPFHNNNLYIWVCVHYKNSGVKCVSEEKRGGSKIKSETIEAMTLLLWRNNHGRRLLRVRV